MKAICVDDEPLLLRSMKRKIEASDSIDLVEAFEYGEDAIEWVENHKIDLAFLDINIRTMTGFEVADRILQLCPDTSIIFCTGYSDKLDQYSNPAVIGCLDKPVMKGDVLAMIEKAKAIH